MDFCFDDILVAWLHIMIKVHESVCIRLTMRYCALCDDTSHTPAPDERESPAHKLTEKGFQSCTPNKQIEAKAKRFTPEGNADYKHAHMLPRNSQLQPQAGTRFGDEIMQIMRVFWEIIPVNVE